MEGSVCRWLPRGVALVTIVAWVVALVAARVIHCAQAPLLTVHRNGRKLELALYELPLMSVSSLCDANDGSSVKEIHNRLIPRAKRLVLSDDPNTGFVTVHHAVCMKRRGDERLLCTVVSVNGAEKLIDWGGAPFAVAGEIAAYFECDSAHILAVGKEDIPFAKRLRNVLGSRGQGEDIAPSTTMIVAMACSSKIMSGANSPASNLLCGQLGKERILRAESDGWPTHHISDLTRTFEAERVIALSTARNAIEGSSTPRMLDRIDEYDQSCDRRSLVAFAKTHDAMPMGLANILCLEGGSEQGMSTQPGAAAADIIAVGDYRGFLEDCGCKAGQMGGLLRLSDAIAEVTPKVVIWQGNMIAWTDNTKSDGLANEVFNAALGDQNTVAVAGGTELLWHIEHQGRDASYPASSELFVLTNAGEGHGYRKYADVTTSTGPTRVIGLFEPTLTSERRETANYVASMMEWRNLDDAVAEALQDWPTRNAVIVAGSFNPARIVRYFDANPRAGKILFLVASSRDPYLPGFVNHVRSWTNDTSWVVCNTAHGNGYIQVAWKEASASRVLLRNPVSPSGPLHGLATSMMMQQQDSVTGPLEHVWTTGRFVGSEACKQCHGMEHKQWAETRHARAFETLEARQRQYVADCVKCHVVGFGLEGGYAGNPALRSVGCENCHGPGWFHAQHPNRENISRCVPATICLECHDEEHSDFDAGEYYPRILHK